MGSTRIPKSSLRSTAESANVSETSSSKTPEPSKVKGGIAEAKDSFAAKKDDQLFALDTTKGQVRFGDGTHGKILEAASKAGAKYRSGLGQSGQIKEQSPVQEGEQKSRFFSGKLLSAGDLAREQESIRTKRTLNSDSSSAPAIPQSGNESGATDPNELVQFVLHESYVQSTEDLKLYAEETKHANQLKKQSALSGIAGKTGVNSDACRLVHKKKKDDGDP